MSNAPNKRERSFAKLVFDVLSVIHWETDLAASQGTKSANAQTKKEKQAEG